MPYSNYVKQAENFIAGLTVPALYNTENLNHIKEYAYYLIESKDEPADKFIMGLQNLLERARPSNDTERESYEIAYFWLVRLKTVFFARLGNAGREKYLDRDFAYALLQGFEVWESLESYLSLLPKDEAQKRARDFASILAKSSTSLEIGGSLGSWLIRYRQHLNHNNPADFTPSLVSVVTFLNTDSAVKSLNDSAKDILRDILTIYTRLVAYRSVGEQLQGTTPTGSEMNEQGVKTTLSNRSISGVRPVVSIIPPESKSSPRFLQESIATPPAPTRPIPPTPAAEPPRAKLDLLKPEVVKRQPVMPPPSPLTAEQQKATLVSGSKLFGMSLSHALANADQGLITTGNIRVGAETEPLFGGDKTSANVPLKSVPTEPSVPITPQTAKPAADALDKVVPNLTPSPQSKITSAPPSVIDLSRRQPLDITAITTPEQLSQIGLFDADGVYFSEKLSQLKQRIVKLADEYQLPISRVAEYFYRSPLYQLFINMGVAVMNDNTAPDQKTAFEKVAANYKAARKETLSYEQFLAFSQFKKEISELEARI